jgi:glycine oxidase
VGYRTGGTVQAAWDGADLAALRDLQALQSSLGLKSELLTSRELRRLEPNLAPGLPGGLLAGDDHSVDNRLLHLALLAAAADEGVELVATRVSRVTTVGDRVTGGVLEGGQRVESGDLVLAAGCWTRAIEGLPGDVLPEVRPVKGQTLRLRTTGDPLLRRTLRGSVRGSPVYLVPRSDGRLIVGASSEEAGFDVRPRAGAVYELLRDAQALLPAVTEAELEEVATGLRPGSPDNAPVIGRTRLEGLVVATGHYRNGVLLTPVTADAVAALLVGKPPDPEIAAFAPRWNGTPA